MLASAIAWLQQRHPAWPDLASIAGLTGRFERAARLFGAAEALRAAIDAPVPRHHTQTLQAIQQILRCHPQSHNRRGCDGHRVRASAAPERLEQQRRGHGGIG